MTKPFRVGDWTDQVFFHSLIIEFLCKLNKIVIKIYLSYCIINDLKDAYAQFFPILLSIIIIFVATWTNLFLLDASPSLLKAKNQP